MDPFQGSAPWPEGLPRCYGRCGRIVCLGTIAVVSLGSLAGCLYSALWPLLTSARWPVSCPHWPVPGPLVLWQVDPSRLCVRRRVSCSLFFDRSLRLGSALGWSARGCLGAIAGVSLGSVAGCSCSVLWPVLTSALWPVSCPYWPVSCTRFWLISAAGWSTQGCLGAIAGVCLHYAHLVYFWGSPTLSCSPGVIPWLS